MNDQGLSLEGGEGFPLRLFPQTPPLHRSCHLPIPCSASNPPTLGVMGGFCKPPQTTVPSRSSRTAVTTDARPVLPTAQASGTLTYQAGEEGVEVILPPSGAFLPVLAYPFSRRPPR